MLSQIPRRGKTHRRRAPPRDTMTEDVAEDVAEKPRHKPPIPAGRARARPAFGVDSGVFRKRVGRRARLWESDRKSRKPSWGLP